MFRLVVCAEWETESLLKHFGSVYRQRRELAPLKRISWEDLTQHFGVDAAVSPALACHRSLKQITAVERTIHLGIEELWFIMNNLTTNK